MSTPSESARYPYARFLTWGTGPLRFALDAAGGWPALSEYLDWERLPRWPFPDHPTGGSLNPYTSDHPRARRQRAAVRRIMRRLLPPDLAARFNAAFDFACETARHRAGKPRPASPEAACQARYRELQERAANLAEQRRRCDLARFLLGPDGTEWAVLWPGGTVRICRDAWAAERLYYARRRRRFPPTGIAYRNDATGGEWEYLRRHMPGDPGGPLVDIMTYAGFADWHTGKKVGLPMSRAEALNLVR